MLSLDMIKSHLLNMIPNIILLSKDIKENDSDDDFAMLNVSEFGQINLDKNELKEIDSKHYGFILSRILIHELFDHKTSVYSQIEINNCSVMSFKDEFWKIRFLSNDIDYLFKNINEVNYQEIDDIKGESGYYLEYYLGKIYDVHTCFIIDLIEDKTNLGILMDSKYE